MHDVPASTYGGDPDRTAPRWQAPRGVLLGLLCGTGGVVAHTAVLGHDVGVLGVPVVGIALAVCLVLAREHLTIGRALAAMTGVQLAGHALMSAPHAEHLMPGECAPLPFLDVATDPRTLLAHVGVAVVTALLAVGADRMVLDALRRLADRVLVHLPAGPRPAVVLRLRALGAPRSLHERLTSCGAAIRGPPVSLVGPVTA